MEEDIDKTGHLFFVGMKSKSEGICYPKIACIPNGPLLSLTPTFTFSVRYVTFLGHQTFLFVLRRESTISPIPHFTLKEIFFYRVPLFFTE